MSSLLRRLILPLSLLLLWEGLGRLTFDPRSPLPSSVLASAFALTVSGQLPSAMLTSLMRVFGGFTVALCLAVPLGLLMGSSRQVERNLDPLVESFRPVAAIAILPLVILWLGTGNSGAIAIVAWAAFFPILINMIAGVKQIEPSLLRAAQTMELSPLTRFRAVLLPAALPALFTGVRIGLGVAWTAIIAAELAVGAKSGSSGGIGQMMFVQYAYSVRLGGIIVCMAAVGLTAYLLDRLVNLIFRHLIPWSDR